jgi:hypothetical protein
MTATNSARRRSPWLVAGWFLPSITIALVGGCENAGPGQAHWLAARDTSGFMALQDAASVCTDCLTIEHVVTMGDSVGPGFVEETHFVTRDSLGRYWLNQRDAVKVFDARGQYVGEVGKPGEGPMEFSYPLPMHTDSAGNVHIIDPGNNRESVVSPEMTLHAESRLPGGGVHSAVPLADGHTYVMNMWLPTPESVGLPLHITDGDRVVRSFGASAAAGPRTDFNIRRRLAIDMNGRIFSIREYDYEIEVWTSEGERIGGLKGPTLNRHEVKPTFYNRDDNPFPNRIYALQVIDTTRLLVISQRPRPDWVKYYEDVTYPQGFVGLRLRDGATRDSVFTSRIEIIDLASRRIVARQDHDRLLSTAVGPLMVLENVEQELIPRITVWRIELSPDLVPPVTP